MKHSEEIDKIAKAIVQARADIDNLYPSAKGYGYTYVPLESIIDHLKVILPKHGLGYVQLPTGGGCETCGLSTMIVHESGQWIEDEAVFPLTDMKGVNKSQAAGSALSYYRRYALCAAFGITGDEDTDATVKQQDNKTPQANTQQKPVTQVTQAEEEARKLVASLGISDAVKRTMWLASGNNMATFVDLLKKEKAARSAKEEDMTGAEKAFDQPEIF